MNKLYLKELCVSPVEDFIEITAVGHFKNNTDFENFSMLIDDTKIIDLMIKEKESIYALLKDIYPEEFI